MSTIFTKIMNGELPGRFIWQDDKCAAFLDISPLTYGHTLVVPREEIDMWTDLPEELNAHVYTVASRIGAAQVKGLGATRAGLIIQGYEVPHMHMHVFPTNSVADFDVSNIIREPDEEKMDEAATKLRAALRDAGYGQFVPED
ncbi:HIT family protein [Enteractinococcus fodinae]|uniref:Histidine triad (HIT) family protein n=1 Tax=Enteractinococcus fodinae TaxID=684663 RepID=A0ABU2B2Z8_9MICC|nr:HIT family protein [Enteractinococcus fodinae]MDR7346779.1 histidine triad (HIT) family protein [Enteractinococcus fodinae]